MTDDVRADQLVKGDVLQIRGDRYVVVKAEVTGKGKWVRLTIDGRRGSFTDDVKAKTVYSRASSANSAPERAGQNRSSNGQGSAHVSGPLHSPDGAQTRWAEISEADLEVPFDGIDLNAVRSTDWTDWDEPASKQEQRLVDRLGARLVAVEVEGGRLVVPAVTDATILGHLATMHARRFDGVTFAEARAWVKANPGSKAGLSEVTGMLELERAYAVHDELHKDLTSMERPHWHREKAPR